MTTFLYKSQVSIPMQVVRLVQTLGSQFIIERFPVSVNEHFRAFTSTSDGKWLDKYDNKRLGYT